MRGQRSDQGTGQCPSSTLEGNGGEGSEHTPRAVTPRAPRAPAALRNGCTGRRHRGGVLGRARGLLRQRRPPGREPAHLAADAPGPVAFARWLPVLLGPGRGIRGHRDQHPHQRPPVRADPGFRRRPHGRPVPSVLAGPGAVRAPVGTTRQPVRRRRLPRRVRGRGRHVLRHLPGGSALLLGERARVPRHGPGPQPRRQPEWQQHQRLRLRVDQPVRLRLHLAGMRAVATDEPARGARRGHHLRRARRRRRPGPAGSLHVADRRPRPVRRRPRALLLHVLDRVGLPRPDQRPGGAVVGPRALDLGRTAEHLAPRCRGVGPGQGRDARARTLGSVRRELGTVGRRPAEQSTVGALRHVLHRAVEGQFRVGRQGVHRSGDLGQGRRSLRRLRQRASDLRARRPGARSTRVPSSPPTDRCRCSTPTTTGSTPRTSRRTACGSRAASSSCCGPTAATSGRCSGPRAPA